jgi:23S rRNA (cytidine1920-2'-O)/16S rRNA (cytidine1409-2'-O)-methyltransferase
VAIVALLQHRFPDVDPVEVIAANRVEINGAIVSNPQARVRDDASVKLRREARLHGEIKLGGALVGFDLSVHNKVALDVGAAAGGFTSALLAAGASFVYAVDAGHGQLVGRLRQDARVANLEKTNLSEIDHHLIPQPVAVITMDLSYLPVSDALPQLARVALAEQVDLVALIKPTFELRRATMAADDESVASAVAAGVAAAQANGWTIMATAPSTVLGHGGAKEAFIHARQIRS